MKVEQTKKNEDNRQAIIFGNKLKALRQERQLSQKQVAKDLNIAVSTYANWEQGRREPCIADIHKLVKVFDVDANELFENFKDV